MANQRCALLLMSLQYLRYNTYAIIYNMYLFKNGTV